MPAVPDEQLHKILQQMQSQLINATRQLNMVKAQLQGCETGKRRIDLTTAQLEAETKQPGSSGSESGGEVRLWQGVGKMFVRKESTDVHAQLRQRKAEVEAEIANLSKKQKFLEKQASDAQGHMRDLFSGLEQQQQQQQQATQ